MNTNEEQQKKPGRPKMYNDPVDVFVRMESDLREKLTAMYPNVSVSRAICVIVDQHLRELDE